MPETPKVGYNPSFLNTPILKGKEIQIKMPNGDSRKGQFAIVELSEIKASHNEKSYGNTEGYPLDANGENVNDRNYTGDVNSQAKIIEYAQNLEPDRLITTSRTPAGTPIITVDGIVVSGNNRTMSLKLAVADYPEKYDEYKRFLAEEIEAFGFENIVGSALLMNDYIALPGSSYDNPHNVKFTNPVLVRIDYDFPDYNALELSLYNKDTKKSERPIDKALKLGKILESSEKCTTVITNIVGQYETFSEFYSNGNDQKKMKDSLVDVNDEFKVMEKERLNSLQGAITIFKSELERMNLSLDVTEGTLKNVVEAGSDFLAFSSLPQPLVPIARAIIPAVAISVCFNKKFMKVFY